MMIEHKYKENKELIAQFCSFVSFRNQCRNVEQQKINFQIMNLIL